MNLASIINVARAVISLIPLTVQLMKSVEEAIPGRGKGEQKLAMVRAFIESVYEEADDLMEPFEAVWSKLENIISSFVAIFHSHGEFKK